MAQNTDELERLTFDPATGGATQAQDPEAAAAEAAAAQSMAQVEAGVRNLVLFALKAARAFIARKLPEIEEEWPDSMLNPPADAAVPLLRRHMARIMEIAGANPEAAALVVACVPLALGYMAAAERHAQTIADAEAKPGVND